MRKKKAMKDSLTANGATIIQQQAVLKAKERLGRLAQSDPAAILKGLDRLSPEEQENLGYLKDEAYRYINISKQHVLNLL